MFSWEKQHTGNSDCVFLFLSVKEIIQFDQDTSLAPQKSPQIQDHEIHEISRFQLWIDDLYYTVHEISRFPIFSK